MLTDKLKEHRRSAVMGSLVSSVIYCIIFFSTDVALLGVGSIISAAFFGLAYYLNERNLASESRFILIICSTIFIFIYSAVLGEKANFQWLFLGSIGSLFSFYQLKEWRQIVFFSSLSIVAILVLELRIALEKE